MSDVAEQAACGLCATIADPATRMVCETEHLVAYTTAHYPWCVVLTTRRHEAEGPWALNDAEAADMGKLTARVTAAIRKTGSERTYIAQFGEELAVAHFHLALLSRFVPMSEAAHAKMWERVQSSTENLQQVADEFGAAVKAQL